MRLNMFRVARKASPGWNVAKSLAQMAVLWCLFLFLGPFVITRAEAALGIAGFAFAAQHVAGTVLFLAASIGAVWSCVTMARIGLGTPLPLDCARNLVVSGPYRFIRNPMAVVAMLQAFGVGIWLGSWTVFVYGLIGEAAWNWILRPMEERDLVERFGAAYEHYRDSVRCWVPTFPGYLRNMENVDR
ncbi:MAG: isoprenylcysteine carboxylmethyltransferase family protein [Bacteroidetes bacterium]|nr:isoprenylcysteine carboxylmethyltransferase family protein [Bacteroidota bacterium]